MSMQKTLERTIYDVNVRIAAELNAKEPSRRRLATFIGILRDLYSAPEFEGEHGRDLLDLAALPPISAIRDAKDVVHNTSADDPDRTPKGIFHRCTSRSAAMREMLECRCVSVADAAAAIVHDLELQTGRKLANLGVDDDAVLMIMLQSSGRIAAIELVRERFGISLVEAKYAVDTIAYLTRFNWDNRSWSALPRW